MEPLSDYHADNSRSDLSDILEEEEEDLYSDHLGAAQARGYTGGAHRVKTHTHPSYGSVFSQLLQFLLAEGYLLLFVHTLISDLSLTVFNLFFLFFLFTLHNSFSLNNSTSSTHSRLL